MGFNLATGEIKWFGGGDLGFVAVEAMSPTRVEIGKGARVVRTTDRGTFVEIDLGSAELTGADLTAAVEMQPVAAKASPRETISGQWRTFVSKADKSGVPKEAVEASHIGQAFDFHSMGLSARHIGLPVPILSYGVHVLPVHLGKGLIASVYVNVAKSKSQAERQRKDFFEKGAEVSFRIETHYPYLEKENGTNEEDEASDVSEEPNFWLSANLHSLSKEANALAGSVEDTAAYVSALCKRIS